MLQPLEQALLVYLITTKTSVQQGVALLVSLEANSAVGCLIQHMLSASQKWVTQVSFLSAQRRLLEARPCLRVVFCITGALAQELSFVVYLGMSFVHNFDWKKGRDNNKCLLMGVVQGRGSDNIFIGAYIIQLMKKTFYINNYLNQKGNNPTTRMVDDGQLPQSRSQKPDYYEQYLQKYNLQHSESAVPYCQSPIKHSTTAETTELSYRPVTAPRKNSEDTIKSQATQRFYYERSNPTNTTPPNSNKSDRQWQLELQLNINKLKDIKSFLQNEIGMLQQLLDETSRSLPNIELEYEKIKERVIDFTARSLDAAFRKYKQQMVRWSKYEEVEKKGLEVVLEMRDYIRERERVLDDIRSGGSVGGLGNSLREVANRVEHYQATSNQFRRMREECLGKHPTLREEKVLEFERVLAELCAF